MFPQKFNIHSWTGTRGCLILSYTPGQVCYYLQPLTSDSFYLSMIHSPVPAWHRRKSKNCCLIIKCLRRESALRSPSHDVEEGVHGESIFTQHEITYTQQGTIYPLSLPVCIWQETVTRGPQTLSSGVLPWWAVCQCPNLTLLRQAEGHDSPSYINLLSRMSVKVG